MIMIIDAYLLNTNIPNQPNHLSPSVVVKWAFYTVLSFLVGITGLMQQNIVRADSIPHEYKVRLVSGQAQLSIL